MKAEHRHELKTNELIEWLTHLPEWAMQNIASIAVVLAVIVAFGAFYGWRNYSRKSVAGKQIELTRLINFITGGKMQILNSQGQTRDMSFILLQPADGLRAFAGSTDNKQLAAMALLKRAEALRAELHYRISPVTPRDVAAQIALAKESYTQAMAKASPNPSLMAAAMFGLGLCEEELGNFDKAQQTYNNIIGMTDFEPTVAYAQAKHRLELLNDYKQNVVFRPAPVSMPADMPTRLGPVDPSRGATLRSGSPAVSPTASAPADANKPANVGSAAGSANAVTQPAGNRDANSTSGTADRNEPGK